MDHRARCGGCRVCAGVVDGNLKPREPENPRTREPEPENERTENLENLSCLMV